LRAGLSLYRVDERLMRDIAPDLIVTQDLCQVCAPSGNELSQWLAALPGTPRILSMTPKSLEGIFGNLQDLGEATGTSERARQLIIAARARLARIAAGIKHLSHRPRVLCMEWIDPVYCCGHWVPEMVELAGGSDQLGRRGTDSVRVAWEAVLQSAPEVLIVMPCGFDLEQAATQARALPGYPGWSDIPAVQSGRVYVVDANAYFARPGPRVIDGIELLAHLLHPALFDWATPGAAYRRLANDLQPQRVQAEAC
jgi:iron complex transport system substrate-binding protein